MSIVVSAQYIIEDWQGELVFEVDYVMLRFGGVISFNDVSLFMYWGEILVVIGLNGVGKMLLFNSLIGVYLFQEGDVWFLVWVGDPVWSVFGCKMHEINRLGVVCMFQNIWLFLVLIALENVKIGVETWQCFGAVSAMLGLLWQCWEEWESIDEVVCLFGEVGLSYWVNELVGLLVYGEQWWLEIVWVMGIKFGVLLLDEFVVGINLVEKRDLVWLIQKINVEDGISVLLIEHDMKLVMSVVYWIVVLNFGEKIVEGLLVQIQRDLMVIVVYFGIFEEEVGEVVVEQLVVQMIDLVGEIGDEDEEVW